jgi:hypothetical protein
MRTLLAVAAALLAVGTAQARPPDHSVSIGWMDSYYLDCEDPAFAPSDHICTVKIPNNEAGSAYVWPTPKMDISGISKTKSLVPGTHVWVSNGSGNVQVSLILPNTTCRVVTDKAKAMSVKCPGIADANDWLTKRH